MPSLRLGQFGEAAVGLGAVLQELLAVGGEGFAEAPQVLLGAALGLGEGGDGLLQASHAFIRSPLGLGQLGEAALGFGAVLQELPAEGGQVLLGALLGFRESGDRFREGLQGLRQAVQGLFHLPQPGGHAPQGLRRLHELFRQQPLAQRFQPVRMLVQQADQIVQIPNCERHASLPQAYAHFITEAVRTASSPSAP
ncbi:hypothetical protein HRbin22_01545 [Candidatus Thermoflexus japonica]|uniref:Uncharacterized protein n=1 Tax=Candidatus Thermoflexus japonica TaxID=2035417 RepID=A0A2H5Y771_9CHLR|nr:hypothetical protein HRbin22_01545 [Candidatus Thermoflexus japonica]